MADDQWVWLVWGVNVGTADLVAIAGSQETRDRYIDTGQRMGKWKMVLAEQVLVDHLYGLGMIGSVEYREVMKKRIGD